MKKTKRLLSWLLCVSMVLAMVPTITVAAADGTFSLSQLTVATEKESTLAPGVTQDAYTVYDKNGDQVKMFVTTADPSVDTVKMFASYKDMDPTNFGMSKLTEQVSAFNEKAEAGDPYYQGTVVAGINASYYNMTTGQPTGIFVMNGVVGNASESAGYFAVMKDGSVKIGVKGDYSNDAGNIQEAIGIYQMLVIDGEICSGLNDSQKYPRQTIGITADGKVILMTADGNQAPKSIGLTVKEQAQVMLDLGCVMAGHLDGGGSCTYGAKAEGSNDFVITNSPSDGSERSISNGFIIVSTAVSDGIFKSASLTAEYEYVTPGSSVSISAVGADKAGFSAEIPSDVSWKLADSTLGTIENGVFTSNGTTGDAVVQLVYEGNVVGETTIHVVIPDSIEFSNKTITVPYGKTATLEMVATYGLNEVVTNASDFVFTLANETAGTISGLSFTACEEATGVTGTTITAQFVDSDLTAEATLTFGKGSEVLFDFEDGTTNGFKTGYISYNYYLPNSDTFVADAENGKVHNGDYSLGVNIDYSNSQESGYMMTALFRSPVEGEESDRPLIGAQRVGMWVYIPDEYVGLWARWVLYPISSVNEDGTVNIASASITSNAIDDTAGGTGVVYSFNESGWHYLSCDFSKYAGAMWRDGYYCVQFYISDRDGASYNYYAKENPNINGNFTIYIDDITVDYSTVVEDREAPIFSGVNYATYGMSDAAALTDGASIANNTVDFTAVVTENTEKANATGIDASTAKAYVDGNEVACTFSNDSIAMDSSAVLSAGQHTIKFSICDKQGNYASIIRKVNITSGEQASVKVVPHDETLDRILFGSLYYVDVVATDIANVQTVTTTLNLDSMNEWELDHMEVAEGFAAAYTYDAPDKILHLTITKTGETELTGEQALVSIPVRVWELDNVGSKIGGGGVLEEGNKYTYAWFKSQNEYWWVAVEVRVQQGAVTLTDGTTETFTGEKIHCDTEAWAIQKFMVETEEGVAYKAAWDGGHIHTASAIDDKAATCTEAGYTDRTYCEVCDSVVDWGTTIPATGHTYDFVDGVLKCTTCGDLFNGEWTDGKLYADGVVVADGWVGESYYRDGMKLTGLQEIDGYYYDFGADGICANKARVDGFFYDERIAAYRYFTAGILTTGEVSIYPEVYFYDADGVAISGQVDVLGYTCYFTERGAFEYSDDASVIDAGYCGTNIQYVLLNNGTLKVDGDGVMQDYSSSGTYPAWVTQNDEKAITDLVVGNGITKIGKFGFFRNPYLKTVTFEENSSLEIIGWGAFGHCWRLTGVTIPASVVTLDSYAFYECGAMKYVDFEENSQLTTINYGAFLHGMALETVFIPHTVTRIGADVFYKANPEMVLQVAEGSVGHSYAVNNNLKYELREGVVVAVESGKLSETIDWTLYSDGTLEISGSGAMPNYTSHTQQPWAGSRNNIQKVVINKDITSVGNYAFAYCQNITAVEFEEGSQMATVGVLSFFNNPKLTEMVLPETVSYISSYAFGDCFELVNVYIPQSTSGIYKTAFSNSTKVVLNVAKGSYGETFAVANNVAYTTRDFVYIPIASGTCGESVTWAMYDNGELWIKGSGAMTNYTSHTQQPWASFRHTIKKVVIGKNVTTVGNYAFAYCQNTTAVEFEEGSQLKTLGVLAFFNNPKLAEIVLPETATYISAYALGDCFALTNVYIPQGVSGIYKTAFTNSSKIVLNVAEGSYAETFAVEHNISHTSRDFVYTPIYSGTCGESVTWAMYDNGELWIKGSGAMTNYTSHTQQPWASFRHTIKKVVIGKNVTTVGNYAFAYCQNITAVEFEEGSQVTTIGVLSFFNNPKLTEIVLPETVTYISAYALGDCFALTNVYIPQGVSGIYKTAFTNSSEVVLNVAEGSYGEQFAIDNGIQYTVR